MDRAPKVFISYSWKSEEYKDTVLHLAERLRGDGVDVILDRWHLRHGYDMYAFMEGGIREADKVLILCEQSYVEKANKRGSGAGTETRIISPALYSESRQDKFIPVFMESHTIVPDYLRGRIGIPFQQQSDAQYEEMLRVIFNVPEVEIPQLGQPPAWLRKKNTSSAPRQAVPVLSAEKQPEPEVELPPPIPRGEDDEDTELPPPIPPVEDDEDLELPPPILPVEDEEPLSPALVKDFDFEPTPEGVIITKYKGKGGKVKIPDKINGQPVIKIAKEAFDYCETLQSVTIPDTVTAIGTRAFNHCTGLISVMLPASLTRIGNSAFCECTALTSITIPDKVESIGQWAFDGCNNMTAATLPTSVKSIGLSAFGTSKLKKVVYSGSFSQWNAIKIAGRNEYLKEAKGHNSVSEQSASSPIEDFEYEVSPFGVTITGYKGDNKVIAIPQIIGGKPVTRIGVEAFKECTNLTSITIPDGITSIGGYAFCKCANLTFVMIPDSIRSIGVYAFYGCARLISITIPNGVTSIGESAFEGCTGLSSVTVLGSVTRIEYATFCGCSSLTSVTIPDSVTTISPLAFSGCIALPSFTIPGKITSIEDRVFECCASLTSVTIPDSVNSIGLCAFNLCVSLTSIMIPDSVKRIKEMAFLDCDNLKDVYFTGSGRQWEAITIGGYNDPLKKATPHYNINKKPWWEALLS